MNITEVLYNLAQLATRNHHDLQNYDASDDHAQYLNVARHDLTARHPLGTVVPHDVLGSLADVQKKFKASDQTINNSTVLVNDNDLVIPIAANDAWVMELFILQTSPSANSDFKVGWAYPVGCAIRWGAVYDHAGGSIWTGTTNASTPSAINIETTTYVYGSGALQQAIKFIAIVINGANAGNINLQWAQGTATVENTVVNARSCLWALKVS